MLHECIYYVVSESSVNLYLITNTIMSFTPLTHAHPLPHYQIDFSLFTSAAVLLNLILSLPLVHLPVTAQSQLRQLHHFISLPVSVESSANTTTTATTV